MEPDSVLRANADLDRLPLPSRADVARRKSVVRQALRFFVLNLKIFKLSRHH
jgi:hypothetical protein